jgi:nucleotide-binding universal stress UspA family protein
MSYPVIVILVGVVWVAIGVVLSVVMRRKGHLGFGWLAVGVLMGPMAVVFALDTLRREPEAVQEIVAHGTPHPGTTDVLIGVDGSPESGTAVEAALRLFRPTLGRITLATVIDLDEMPGSESERRARAMLAGEAARVRAREPASELFRATRFQPELLVLRGSPAKVLSEAAATGGYEVLVVGRRGAGLAKTLLGSVARTLAGGCPVPALIVTPQSEPHPGETSGSGRDRVPAGG